MSQNIFHIDPIFFLPIDLDDNLKNKEEDNPKNDKINNIKENFKKNKENTENESTNEDSSSSGKELDQSQDIDELKKEENTKTNKEINTIVFSKSVNDPHIKSMTNSSKIYICEIFKQNWKLKARRLITKLKKRLIKEYQKSSLREENKKTNVYNSIYNNNYINNNSNDINNINVYKNTFVNNSNRMYNILNGNKNFILGNNYCNNIGINYKQINNNYQGTKFDQNSFINNNNEDLFTKLLIINNICC